MCREDPKHNAQRGPKNLRACVCEFLEMFETPPAIPRQEIEREGKREKQGREVYTTHRVQWGEERRRCRKHRVSTTPAY